MRIKGEICLYGGAVMCLVYDARPSTKDVDAIFQPTKELREAIKRVAVVENLREDWLNDAVKDFVVPHSQQVLFDFSHLSIYIPETDYLLAMKTLAAQGCSVLKSRGANIRCNALNALSSLAIYCVK